MEPLTAPTEDKWGVCEFLALPFNSVDEAIGVRRTVSGDIEADLDEILLCCWELLDDPHQADLGAATLPGFKLFAYPFLHVAKIHRRRRSARQSPPDLSLERCR